MIPKIANENATPFQEVSGVELGSHRNPMYRNVATNGLHTRGSARELRRKLARMRRKKARKRGLI